MKSECKNVGKVLLMEISGWTSCIIKVLFLFNLGAVYTNILFIFAVHLHDNGVYENGFQNANF